MTKNVIQEFKNAMLEHGIQTNDAIIDDGQLHRIHVIGDKKGTKNGAYILHNDNKPAGWFQHFSKSITGKWTASGKREPLSRIDLEQIKQAQLQREQERQQRFQETALKARILWQQCTPTQTHDYLIKKRIKPHNTRVLNNSLVIPLWNENKKISTLQFINAKGDKWYLSGGQKAGCFAVIGTLTDTVLICEGFATGASLHEDTGYFVACAMDAPNLEPVARVMRRLLPTANITICGDNDSHNVGQIAAKKAAIACNGKYILPPITGMDFNDYINSIHNSMEA